MLFGDIRVDYIKDSKNSKYYNEDEPRLIQPPTCFW
jgi:hypothetical protein